MPDKIPQSNVVSTSCTFYICESPIIYSAFKQKNRRGSLPVGKSSANKGQVLVECCTLQRDNYNYTLQGFSERLALKDHIDYQFSNTLLICLYLLCPYHSLTPDLHYVLNKLLLVPKAFSQTALRLKMTSAYTYNNDNKTDKIQISLIELHKYWCPLCSSHASKTTGCDKNTMCSVDQLPHKRRY